MLRFARNFDFDLIYNKDSFQNNLWGNSLREYYASNNSSSWVPFIPLGPISGKVFQWLEMSWRLLINCYEDIYEKGYLWRDTNIHHEYFSIVYNNWILGEPDKPDKCHYSQWFSYTRETSLGNQVKKTIYTLVITDLSSPLFVGIPKKNMWKFFWGEGELFSCKASNYWGALPDDWGQGGQMSPSVSFWWKCQSHQSQTMRSMGLVGSNIINNMSDNQGKLWHKNYGKLSHSDQVEMNSALPTGRISTTPPTTVRYFSSLFSSSWPPTSVYTPSSQGALKTTFFHKYSCLAYGYLVRE